MSPGLLRTPQDDGSILIHPQPADLSAILSRNRRRISSVRTVLDLPLDKLRRQAAVDVVRMARTYLADNSESAPEFGAGPLFVAGHQPDLFHPGVWIKNFALNALARAHGGVALNLIVDTDDVKRPAVDVPHLDRDPAGVRVQSISYDSVPGGLTFEQWRIRDAHWFDSFADRIRQQVGNWPFEPMLADFWQGAVRRRARTESVRDLLAGARRDFERRWGCVNLEVPLSGLTASPAVADLAAAVLRNLPTVRDSYNAAIANYRRRRRLRSRQHPAPDLARDGDWLEAPFWGRKRDSVRRERLFARSAGGRLHLRAGGEPWPDLPIAADGPALRRLESDGFRIQTRALTTTLFSRLLLADVFIHGIGGAKYDEVTDEIIARLTASEPPEFLVVSGTLRLPFPSFPAGANDVRAARRRIRDLDWNPQRDLGPAWTARHDHVGLQSRATRAERRELFRRWRALNDEMRPLVAARRAEAVRHAERLAHEVAANERLQRRDYAFVLYPESKLRPFLQQLSQ